MFWQSYIQRRGDTSLESRAMQRMLFPHIRYLSSRRAFACPEPRTFGTMKLEAMFHCVQNCNLIFFSGGDVFESAALISPSAILDFHSQHSVHSAPGSRMDGMAFCPFRNRNVE